MSKQRGRPKLQWTEEMLATLRDMRERGAPLFVIAERVGVSYATANLKCRELAFPRRTDKRKAVEEATVTEPQPLHLVIRSSPAELGLPPTDPNTAIALGVTLRQVQRYAAGATRPPLTVVLLSALLSQTPAAARQPAGRWTSTPLTCCGRRRRLTEPVDAGTHAHSATTEAAAFGRSLHFSTRQTLFLQPAIAAW